MRRYIAPERRPTLIDRDRLLAIVRIARSRAIADAREALAMKHDFLHVGAVGRRVGLEAAIDEIELAPIWIDARPRGPLRRCLDWFRSQRSTLRATNVERNVQRNVERSKGRSSSDRDLDPARRT